MGNSIGCCQDLRNERNKRLSSELETHVNEKDEEDRILNSSSKPSAARALSAEQLKDPKHRSAAKIQSVAKAKLFRSKFQEEHTRRKNALLGFFMKKNQLCKYDSVDHYVCPKVLQVENDIKTRQGVFNSRNLPGDFYRDFSVKSFYNIQLPCIHLTEDHGDNPPVFKGYWSIHKMINGFGVLVNSEGSKYEGNFRNDKLDGYGRYITKNGDYFEGNFERGIATGYGVFIHADGNIYKGNWINDLPWGQGEEWGANGSYYKGDFINGKKSGKGRFRWEDGSTYIGQVKEDLLNGEGNYTWADGKVYSGQWKNNEMHGTGTIFNPDGSRYEGEFQHGKKEGRGRYIWNEGKYYEGEFKDGKQHGKGMIVKNGKVEHARWHEGKKLKQGSDQ